MIVVDASATLEILLNRPVAAAVRARIFRLGETLHELRPDLAIAKEPDRLSRRLCRLAEMLRAPLLTADARLAKSAPRAK